MYEAQPLRTVIRAPVGPPVSTARSIGVSPSVGSVGLNFSAYSSPPIRRASMPQTSQVSAGHIGSRTRALRISTAAAESALSVAATGLVTGGVWVCVSERARTCACVCVQTTRPTYSPRSVGPASNNMRRKPSTCIVPSGSSARFLCCRNRALWAACSRPSVLEAGTGGSR